MEKTEEALFLRKRKVLKSEQLRDRKIETTTIATSELSFVLEIFVLRIGLHVFVDTKIYLFFKDVSYTN
jgi:hypothetical protein